LSELFSAALYTVPQLYTVISTHKWARELSYRCTS